MKHPARLLMLALGIAAVIGVHGAVLYLAWSNLALPIVLAVVGLIGLKHIRMLDKLAPRLKGRLRFCPH